MEIVNVSQKSSRRVSATLLFSLFVAASCGIFYELLLSTVSSYFLGSAVLHFSITIGLFLSFMGVGSGLSRFITNDKKFLEYFLWIEIALGIVGGFSVFFLFSAFSFTQYYYLINFFSIAIIATLMGIEIPLLTRILEKNSNLKDALSNVLSFDYLGALVASLLFPLVLLPYFGTLKTGFFIGMLNIGVAIFTLWVLRSDLEKTFKLWFFSIGTFVVLLIGFFSSYGIASFFETFLYKDEIVTSEQSQYQKVVMTKNGNDVRLFLNGHLQFSSVDEYRYHETLVHSVMTYSRTPETVLVMGGGDGMAVRELLKYPDIKKIFLVDLDPVITNLAKNNEALKELNNSSLSDPRVTVVNMDAQKFLQESPEIFSVVIADFPDPSRPEIAKLYSKEFYILLRKKMAKDGVFITQSTSPFFAREVFWMIGNTLSSVFPHSKGLHAYVPAFGEWGFQLAFMQKTPGEYPLYFSHLPSDLKYFTPQIFTQSQLFPKDIEYIDTEINTLDRPIIVDVYGDNWGSWE